MRSWLGRGRSLQAGITVCCLVAFVLFGYDQGVFGGILQNADWLDQFAHPSDIRTGIIVSCYNLGCLTGCIVNFCVGEHLGRRRTIWLAMAIVIVGATLQTSAFNVAHLVVGRIVTGIGTGIKTSTVPPYQAELCDRQSRGRLVSAEVLFVGVGIVIAYWFDFGMSFVGGPIAWRLPIAFQMVFAVGVIVLVFALPESPRWLFNHGRDDEAVAVLCAVHDRDASDPCVESERRAILDAIALERAAEGGDGNRSSSSTLASFASVFRRDEVRTGHRVLLAWGMQFMNQVGGINLVVYYIPSVLVQNVGMDAKLAQILGGCINMMFMFGSLLPTFALDRMGRRKTMMWGSFGLGISMLMIAALLSQAAPGDTSPRAHAFASASVAFFFTYMLVFGGSVNCVPWVYVAEILPLAARTRGAAIGVSSNWLWNFTIVMITPIIINRLQWKAYLIFTATNLLFVPTVYFFYPETSNIQLEDIDRIFSQGGNPVEVARKLEREMRRKDRDAESSAPSQSEKPREGVEMLEHTPQY
ncbi:Sugar transporter STL1 [Purpureocillium lavendulum]|uniref:Sugar transporter STL1 n=1 Tax=Purpureocillium lavendulum TaxID=1247861 RepID=A0AB34FL26_9HYPO|nr:Sugar transporter STL1 [Purpureocillium lavendulum]